MKLLDYTWISVKKLDELERLVKSTKAQLQLERITNKQLRNTISTQQHTIKTLETLLDIEQQNTRNNHG